MSKARTKDEIIEGLLSDLSSVAMYIEGGIGLSKTPNTDSKAVNKLRTTISDIREDLRIAKQQERGFFATARAVEQTIGEEIFSC